MKQRVVTALIGLIIFLVPLYMGGPLFVTLVTVMAIVAFIELLRMKRLATSPLLGFVGLGMSLLLLYAGPRMDIVSNEATLLAVTVGVWLLLLVTVLSNNRYHFDTVAFILFSGAYVGLGLHFFLAARLDSGFAFVLFVLIAIWATDTGAYLFGRKFGKRPLWPKISPKKTVEGAAGGFLLALVAGLIFAWFWPPFDQLWLTTIALIIISVAGQCGDLVESALKRYYNVKDSGRMLPGHGGVLDRFDSVIFVFPIIYVVMALLT
ncbi:phosphatidate cytidylyltransferase [Natribacillus halophilus]|uniref:Phosphatidate cytidylyltransferase n=1 Tax=Natribacillus halophilus TaxID=549003 RepID=A0A1G8PPK2_9BACI|nr:phosphatidate cytidylyltransferase [Natribacillus halophilus]SDI94434.1 phosphatidate cytidylyltransferase [Natribacillus halophilus]